MGLDHSLRIYNKEEQEVATLIWRKENHIHKWWVDRHPEGDNGEDTVSGDDLLEFYETCEKVMHSLNKGELETQTVPNGWTYENGVKTEHTREAVSYKNTEVAEELMPPQAGFFYGSTAIDEYYYHSLDNVIKEFKPFIEDLRKTPDGYDGIYWSWW